MIREYSQSGVRWSGPYPHKGCDVYLVFTDGTVGQFEEHTKSGSVVIHTVQMDVEQLIHCSPGARLVAVKPPRRRAP